MIESKKLTRLVILCAAGILLICLTAYIFTHKFITLRVDNPDHIANLSYHATTMSGAAIPSPFGIYIISSGEPLMKVTSTSGEETVVPVTPLSLVTTHLPVTLQKTKKVDVYSSQSLGCNTYEPTQDRVVTYKCATAADALYAMDSSSKGPWRNTKLQDIALGLSYYNYGDGIIALTASDASDRTALIYSPSGLSYYKLNDTASRTSTVDVAVDATDRTNRSFAVYSSETGDVAYYAFAPGATQPTATEYHPASSQQTTDTLRSRCVMAGTKVYCIRGTFASPNGDNSAQTSQPEVSEIDFSQPHAAAATYTIKQKLPYLTGIYTDHAQHLYLTNDTDLYEIVHQTPQLVYPHTTSVASGKEIVLTSDSGLYRVDPAGQAIKTYANNNLQLSTISSYGDSLLFDVFSKNDTLFAQGITLKVSASADDGSPSLLNVLPLSTANLPITSAAMSHNTLQVLPTAYMTSDRATGTFSYDQQQYADSKSKIQQYLSGLIQAGKLPSTLSIVYAQ